MGSDEDDVEKRWHDPQMFRSAVGYVVAVVAVAGLALAFYAFDHSTLSATLVPTITFVGALGAFFRTYQVWKARGTWQIWQGAGWFLLALSLICLAVPGSAMLS